MDIEKEQNNEETNIFIERELEEELNENERHKDLNEMEFYCDEPSELIDVKYIEEYSRQNFFLEMEQNINNKNINYNNNQLNNNCYLIPQNCNNSNNNSNYLSNNKIISHDINNINKKRVFYISKYPKNKEFKSINSELKKFLSTPKDSKRYYKNQNINWDAIEVPKEKHFHFDRKKHRIVFQRKHLKVIYSIIGLSPPINFSKCFNMIKEHIGDKTLQNFGKGKSFHIIREGGEEKIVTLKDKKLKLNKNKCMYKNENNEKNNEMEQSKNN